MVSKNVAGEIAMVNSIPHCDICKVLTNEIHDAVYDAKITMGGFHFNADGIPIEINSGPWANMCELHWWQLTNKQLGIGIGQRLIEFAKE